ncbi:MAG: 50S ribosomal protein L25 [Candidatus Paceibacterota bacterium]|jgi:large subunit ribosomal protein L25
MAMKLKVEKRDAKADLGALRKEGKFPAVYYGKKEASTPITISYADFVKAWRQAGESTVIELSGEGVDVESLIHDVDLHPVTGRAIHADFYVFEKGKKIEVGVPLDFIGIAPAVKDLGGTLVKVLYQLEVSALPKDLPHKIEVDISPLVDFKSVIRASDLKLPAGVELAVSPEDIIASVYEPKEEVEEVAPVDLSAIEVEKKGKEAKEGEAPAEGEAAAPKKEEKK